MLAFVRVDEKKSIYATRGGREDIHAGSKMPAQQMAVVASRDPVGIFCRVRMRD